MLKKLFYALGVGMGCFISTLAILLVFGFSWLIVCGIVKLITLCFCLAFSWKIATSIWLLFIIIGALVNEWGEKKK